MYYVRSQYSDKTWLLRDSLNCFINLMLLISDGNGFQQDRDRWGTFLQSIGAACRSYRFLVSWLCIWQCWVEISFTELCNLSESWTYLWTKQHNLNLLTSFSFRTEKPLYRSLTSEAYDLNCNFLSTLFSVICNGLIALPVVWEYISIP